MLTRAHRLVNPLDFKRVVRRGGRFSGRFSVTYLARSPEHSSRAGFIVARNIGNAVTRNLVKRRLRAATANLWAHVHGDLVIRALPAAASATYTELHSELARAIRELHGQSKQTPEIGQIP